MFNLLLTLLIASDCYIRVDEVTSNGFVSGKYASSYYHIVNGEFQLESGIYFTLEVEHQFSKQPNRIDKSVYFIMSSNGEFKQRCYYNPTSKFQLEDKYQLMFEKCLCPQDTAIEKLLDIMSKNNDIRRLR